MDSSIIFFVSPRKINKILPYLKKNFSGRKILICREMTKYYEEYIRTDIDDIEKLNFELKGELTIVISDIKLDKKNSQNLSESDKRLIKEMIKKLSTKEIINFLSQNKKISKKEVYNYCIKIKNEK